MSATATIPPGSTPRQFTAFRCPPAVLAALKEQAAAEGRSLSNYIVRLLDHAVTHRRRRHG